jgi:hypothetical protein
MPNDNEQKAARLIDSMTVAMAIGQRDEAQKLWREAVQLIQQRTPEEIRRLEAERGLI